MSDDRTVLPDPQAEALQEVLEAEAAAREAIAQCEHEAARLLEQARAQVRRIHDRADARIATLEVRCRHATSRIIEQLQREDAALTARENDAAADRDALERAIEALARELTRGAGKPDAS